VGAHAPRRAEKKIFQAFTGKCVSAPPGHEVYLPSQSKSQFLGQYAGWLRLEVYLDAILRATTKKRSTIFLGKKGTPDKILATPMRILWCSFCAKRPPLLFSRLHPWTVVNPRLSVKYRPSATRRFSRQIRRSDAHLIHRYRKPVTCATPVNRCRSRLPW